MKIDLLHNLVIYMATELEAKNKIIIEQQQQQLEINNDEIDNLAKQIENMNNSNNI